MPPPVPPSRASIAGVAVVAGVAGRGPLAVPRGASYPSGREDDPVSDPTLDQLFDFFWRDYSRTTPDAPRIHALLGARGERVVNDHVAFRTYDLTPVGVDALAEVFLARGYRDSGEYRFEEKKLRARSFQHPEPGRPHVFVSELLTGQFSADLQRIVRGLVAQVPAGRPAVEHFTQLPTWAPVAHADYLRLREESEYAAWLAAFGIRVNHFTVSVNALSTFDSLEALNAFLVANGFRLNTSGGEVKGTPAQLLEQSSILASRIPWTFAGGETQVIPGCYYEFARRYPDPATGALYSGFIARSADKIFESTDSRL